MTTWLALAALFLFGPINAYAQMFDPSFFGTQSVTFERMQMEGTLTGCTLPYSTIVQDGAYSRNRPIALSGLVAYVSAGGLKRNLVLKIGTKDVTLPNSPILPPNFAYLQTENSTTARSKFTSQDSADFPGYKLFVIQLDEKALRVLIDLVAGRPLLIGYNNTPGGIDVMAKLETDVADSSSLDGIKVVRQRSSTAIDGFRECFVGLNQDLKPAKP